MTNENDSVKRRIPTIEKRREPRIDLIKGIAIILMVIGHSGVNYGLYQWIYLFHMAIFFIAAGYCRDSSILKTDRGFLLFLWRKVKTLYLPYVAVNLFFLFLNNAFVSWNLYDAAYRLTANEIFVLFFRVLAFQGELAFGMATWFLRILFFVSVTHGLIFYLLNKLRFSKKRRMVVFFVLWGCFVVFAQLICLSSEEGLLVFFLPQTLKMCAEAYVVYGIGIIFKKVLPKIRLSIVDQIVVFICSVAVLFMATNFGTVSLSELKITGVIFFIIVSLAGWLMLWYIAKFLGAILPYAANLFVYIGRNTLSIVFFHLIAFKIVTYIWITNVGLPMEKLSSFPTLPVDNAFLWIAYAFVGVSLPLLCNYYYQYIKIAIVSRDKKMRMASSYRSNR